MPKPMKDYDRRGLFCEYEYCIEEQPLVGGELRCPVWGHDCPGGIAKIETCGKDISDIPEERIYKMKKEEPAKQRIEKEIIRVMSKSINKEANEDNFLYYRGFINGCKFSKIIDAAEGVELNAYLTGLFTENRRKLEGNKK